MTFVKLLLILLPTCLASLPYSTALDSAPHAGRRLVYSSCYTSPTVLFFLPFVYYLFCRKNKASVTLILINCFLFCRKRPQNKMKKSPVGSWRSFFNLGKSSSVSKRKLQRNESEPSEMKAMALKGEPSATPSAFLMAAIPCHHDTPHCKACIVVGTGGLSSGLIITSS